MSFSADSPPPRLFGTWKAPETLFGNEGTHDIIQIEVSKLLLVLGLGRGLCLCLSLRLGNVGEVLKYHRLDCVYLYNFTRNKVKPVGAPLIASPSKEKMHPSTLLR
jgi:hypothetical protein